MSDRYTIKMRSPAVAEVKRAADAQIPELAKQIMGTYDQRILKNEVCNQHNGNVSTPSIGSTGAASSLTHPR